MSLPSHTNSEWLGLLRGLLTSGKAIGGANPTRELLNMSTRINMRHPMITVAQRRLSPTFAAAEARWIASGDNSLAALLPYAPSYSRFSDDGLTLSGAYGPKVVSQIDYVVECLMKDPLSRQAVINIWRESPRPSRDIPCTLSAHWIIRNRELHCFDTMRSSDAWLGWPYDVFSFSMLTHLIAVHLRQAGVAIDRVGVLHLTAASSHIYESDVSKARMVLMNPGAVECFVMPSLSEFTTPHQFMTWLESLRDDPSILKSCLTQNIQPLRL